VVHHDLWFASPAAKRSINLAEPNTLVTARGAANAPALLSHPVAYRCLNVDTVHEEHR